MKHSRDFHFNSRSVRYVAFTLIEVMIAAVLTLLLMAALAKGFKVLSDSMLEGRSRLALIDKVRGVAALLRNDLEGCTARPVPPLDTVNGTGYFEIYDGALTDYSATYFGFDRNAEGTELIANSRFGDPDDVLMFTARAKGEPFKGRVPRAIIKASQNPTGQIIADDWLPANQVFIASEYAEIIYFMLPAPSADALATGNVIDATTGLPNYSRTAFGFPTEYRLFRRVLLIRPDLNVAVPGVSEPILHPDLTQNLAQNPYQVIADLNNIQQLHMAKAHQNCDLSIRRVRGNSNSIAANSLEDLKRRENRFAHWAYAIGLGDSTMPLLSLTDPLDYPQMNTPAAPISIGNPTAGIPHAGRTIAFGSGTIPHYSGFLHPAFALSGARLGEDMLMSGAIAFDLKVFDPGVQNYYHAGVDGILGTGSNDAGSAPSDDLVVSPNDPGYPAILLSGNAPPLAYQGEFVDLCWGPKVYSLALRKGLSLVGGAAANQKWVTPFSGFASAPLSNGIHPFTLNLIKSGTVARASPGAAPTIYQPTYDTWATSYETDNQRTIYYPPGEFAAWASGGGYFGINPTGVTPNTNAGLGGNNIDDNGNGLVDEFEEKETSPPFPSALTAIKIEIRAEDSGTGMFQQISVVHDFLSH